MIGFPPLTVGIFCVTVLALLVLDLSMHRKDKIVSLGSAVSWSLFYVAVALAFAGYLFMEHGSETASLFLTGYALEKVLAFDNLFVFSLIFSYFAISPALQHKALYWGIGGAIVFRLIFVVIGAGSVALIGPMVELVFAALIFFSVYLMLKSGDDDDVDYMDTWYAKAIKKVYPNVSAFVLAIVAIEISDIMFSFDSVPAIIAVTKDPLLIYSAMIFAILGLRSMYFIIAALSRFFVYMDTAVIVVLIFIGMKLTLNALFGLHIDPIISLGIILTVLAGGAFASVMYKDER
jgi:tellurite resistance protein TerC